MNSILSGSLNNVSILKNKRKLIEELEPKAQIEIKLLILTGSTIAELKDFLYLFLLNNGIKANILESTYNSYYEDIVFNNLIEKHKPDWVYVHTTNKNLIRWPDPGMNKNEVESIYKDEVDKFKLLMSKLNEFGIKAIVNNFEYRVERVFGNFDAYSDFGYVNYVNRLNLEMCKIISEYGNIHINDIMYISSSLGLNKWFSRSYWHSFKYAVAPQAMPHLARSLSNIIKASYGMSKKVLVCDLDNTLWGGVVGDDGYNNLSIGPNGPLSESFSELQSYINVLQKRGIVLAVNSKNESSLAKTGFDNEFCLLNLKDFAVFKANWNQKSINIKEIEKEINIRHDAFVFIDDSKYEIEQIKSVLPDVVSFTYEKSPTEIIDSLVSEGVFESLSLSSEDQNRTELYQARSRFEGDVISIDEYLATLKMRSSFSNINKTNSVRVEQLINKTNQFNPTTARVSSRELDRYGERNFVVSLEDIYGNSGIVSVLLYDVFNNRAHIDIWVMSCRVFNRKLENAIFDEFIKTCIRNDVSEVSAKYIKSKKNGYVRDLYTNLGFTLVKSSGYEEEYLMKISDYEARNELIEVIYEA